MEHEYEGLFVVFEGGEGSGKSTQAKQLAEALRNRGIPYLPTYEPGDTELGRQLRQILLDPDRDPISKKAEALLFAADRAEHVKKIILPALNEGKVVICDRYIASTIAYQSYGNGLDTEHIRTISDWASDELYPDITFFLNIDPIEGLRRAALRGKQTRIDARSIGYHDSVRHGFCVQVNDYWQVLDARDTVYSIHTEVLNQVLMRLNDKRILREQQANVKDVVFQRTFGCPQCNADLLASSELQQYSCPNGHGYMQFRMTNAVPHP